MDVLKKRIITAMILIPITLFVLFYASPPVFCIVTGLLSLAAAWEWSNLMELKTIPSRISYVLVNAFIFYFALFYLPIHLILMSAFIFWLFATCLVALYPRTSSFWGKSLILRGAMGLAVLLPCWIAINFIRDENNGIYALLYLFILIWGADSAAYFVGKKWGKDKLAPLVSPGKSKQGFYGALVFTSFIALVFLLLSQPPFTIWLWVIVLSLATVVFSVIGDLFESMMKRQVGLKDSGNLLPGHGGLLDRIDSLTAAAPMFALGGLFLGWYLS
jgi:phosphatidate cytidylyltransferase